jgi:hypothetical protein
MAKDKAKNRARTGPKFEVGRKGKSPDLSPLSKSSCTSSGLLTPKTDNGGRGDAIECTQYIFYAKSKLRHKFTAIGRVAISKLNPLLRIPPPMDTSSMETDFRQE